MNDSAGEQISELLNSGLQIPTTDALDSQEESDEQSDVRSGREGLPRHFRMRHDAHYVDELLAARSAPPATAAPHATALPSLALIAGRLESRVAHNETIAAHAGGASLIAQSVNAEFGRLARLARAAVLIHDPEPIFRRNVTAGEIADAVCLAAAPIARLAGVACDMAVEDRAFAIQADPSLVVQAIVGTVDAVAELLQAQPRRFADPRQPQPRMSINVQSMKVRPAVIVDVACPALLVGPRQAERFFDNKDEDYRAVPGAGILLAAAAQVARAHGGRSDVKRVPPGSVTITFVYPQALGDTRFA